MEGALGIRRVPLQIRGPPPVFRMPDFDIPQQIRHQRPARNDDQYKQHTLSNRLSVHKVTSAQNLRFAVNPCQYQKNPKSGCFCSHCSPKPWAQSRAHAPVRCKQLSPYDFARNASRLHRSLPSSRRSTYRFWSDATTQEYIARGEVRPIPRMAPSRVPLQGTAPHRSAQLATASPGYLLLASLCETRSSLSRGASQ